MSHFLFKLLVRADDVWPEPRGSHFWQQRGSWREGGGTALPCNRNSRERREQGERPDRD